MRVGHGLALRTIQSIGLDIGSTAVKAVRVRRKGGRYTVLAVASAAVDESHVEGTPEQKAAAAVRRCLHQLGGRTGEVVCGLAGPDVAVRTFNLPALPRKKLHSAVELEAAQVCPFDVAEGTVACHQLQGPSGRRAGRSRGKGEAPRSIGVFAAARNEAIRQVRLACERAGTRCVLLDVDGLALLNCLEGCRARTNGETVLVLNVGGQYTNLAILSADGLPYVRDIAYAGRAILPQACAGTGAGPETWAAEDGATRPVPCEAPETDVRRACAALAERVIETVRYYGAQKAGLGVDRILLCGGLVRLEAVRESLISLMEGKVELWNPLASLRCARAVRKSGAQEQGSMYAVALGLAMRSVRDVPD